MIFVVSGIFFPESFPDHSICLGIYRTGRVIQDQDFRFLKQSSGDTQPLFLTAGNVISAFHDHSIIFIREFLDKAVCLSQATDSLDFLI